MQKSIWQNPTPNHEKSLSKLEIKRNFLNFTKNTYKNL